MSEQPATAERATGRARARWALLGFALAGTALWLTQLGYRFEALDQLQYLLLPYRQIDPGFVPGDWFTWHTSHYHHSYAVVVRAIAWLSGEHFPEAMFAAHLGVLALLSYGLGRVALAAGLGWAGASAALLMGALIREDAIAGATLNHGQLIPADLALPPFLLACAAWLEGRARRLGIWLGVSGLLHANFAVLGPLTFAPLWLFGTPRSERLVALREVSVGFVPIAAPSLVLIGASFFATDTAPEALEIMFRVRSPHHYDVRAMPPEDLWWPVTLALVCVPALWSRRAQVPGRRLLGLLAALCAVVAISLVGSLVRDTTLVRLFTFRMSVPLLSLLAMTFGADVRQALATRDASRGAFVLSGAAVLACFARDDLPRVAGDALGPGLFALPAVAALLASGLSFVSARLGWARLSALVALGWAVLVARVPLETEWHAKRTQPVEHRGPRLSRIEIRSELHPLHELVRAGTPPDASFLIPPSLIDFRLMARRAVFVDWKCAPMRGDELLEWKRRMLAVIGTRDFPFTGYELRKGTDALYEARSPAVLLALARSEGLTHAVLPRGHRGVDKQGGELLGKAGHWAVYRVLSSGEWAEHKRKLMEHER